MDYAKLDSFSYSELKNVANDMDIPIKRSRVQLIDDIKRAFQEYENYKQRKVDRYTKIRQLGHKGKEGTTYLVLSNKDNNGV